MGSSLLSVKCLESLRAYENLEVKAVVAVPPRPQGRGLKMQAPPTALKAQELNLPLFMPESLKDSVFLSQIKNLKAQGALVLAYGKILPKAFLNMFPEKCLNFHASLLPKWRGAAPVERALMAGDSKTGMSLQVMGPGLDTGPLISVKSFDVTDEMDSQDVFQKMEGLTVDMLDDVCLYMQGLKSSTPQKEHLKSYAEKVDKKESLIMWSNPAQKILNQVRALSLGPVAYTFYKKKRLKIYKAKMGSLLADSKDSAGCVKALDSKGVQVLCGDQFLLRLQEVQMESKKRMPADLWAKGFGIKPGDILGSS